MDYKVKRGDCLSSICEQHGYDWKKVWDHDENSSLRDKRGSPHVLYPGDIVSLPEKDVSAEKAATDQEHQFKIKSVPLEVKICFVVDDEPLGGVAFEFRAPGAKPIKGKTTGDGVAEIVLPSGTREGEIVVGEGEEQVSAMLQLGELDPVDTPSGLKDRLNNLGYGFGDDDPPHEEVLEALRAFQEANDLDPSGDVDEVDQKTQDRLIEAHGT